MSCACAIGTSNTPALVVNQRDYQKKCVSEIVCKENPGSDTHTQRVVETQSSDTVNDGKLGKRHRQRVILKTCHMTTTESGVENVSSDTPRVFWKIWEATLGDRLRVKWKTLLGRHTDST